MILVTGASGTIGSATVEALKMTKAPFKVGMRSAAKAAALGVEAVAFDWDDAATYASAFKGVERLFLLTQGTDRAHGYILMALAAARRAGVKHIVRLSVAGADVEPGITLARQHRASEKDIEQSGIAWTHLRPTFYMQNFVNYYGLNPKSGGTVYLPNADGQVSWVDAKDVGAVAAKVLTDKGHEGQAYTLTGGEATTTAEAVAVFSKVWGQQCSYVSVPDDAGRSAMEGMGFPAWYADGLVELSQIIRAGYASGVSDAVAKVLGRAPTTLAEWAKSVA